MACHFFLDIVRPLCHGLNMAHIHKKIKNGRPCYYVREMARIDGKPKVVNQVYLGSPERIMQMATGGRGGPIRIAAQEFGALWLANLIEQDIGLVSIINSVLPRKHIEKGPTIGEYFLYSVFNHMIDSCSKSSLGEWYRGTAIQSIRPVDIEALNSQRFWEKWDRVKTKDIEEIGSRFFEKIVALAAPESGCFLFDTTNYYTFMASDTDSELAQRGKNKEGRDWLRQIGVALLVSRDHQMPLFYKEYEGNRHDSKLFNRIIEQVLCAMEKVPATSRELTIVFDKGMNSEDNIAAIDSRDNIHFITTYSTFFAEELTRIKLSEFSAVDTVKNHELVASGREDDQIAAYRSSGEFWGKERRVVVTYNPVTAAKQRYAFDKKLMEIQDVLFYLRSKVQTQDSKWVKPGRIEKHYADVCERVHLPKDLYDLSVEQENRKWKLIFRKNHYRIGRYIERFGKNIIVTDHMDWTTDEIVKASLDRYMVEKAFRQTKDDDLVSILPLRHWTDGKIRCHILTCVIALTYLRIIESRLSRAAKNQRRHSDEANAKASFLPLLDYQERESRQAHRGTHADPDKNYQGVWI